ncbi:MAG: ABC transporter permease [Gemmatimonadaceae bacterium]
MAIATGGTVILRALFLPEDTVLSVLTDTRTLLFAGVLALGAGLLTGLVPALQAGRGDLASALKSGSREGVYQRSRLRSVLLVAQGALSVVLLVGAGLFVGSLQQVRSMRLGYDVDPLVLVSRNMRGVTMSDTSSALLGARLEAEVKAIPGVESASRVLTVPMYNTWSAGIFVEGSSTASKGGPFTLQAGPPDFFRTSGTRIVRGRGFTTDDAAHAPPVAVVSGQMAATLWPGQEALGRCMRVEADSLPCVTVVGIAEEMHQHDLTSPPGPSFYLPIEQFSPEDADLLVRVTGNSTAMAEVLRRQLQPLMPGDAYLNAVSFRQIIEPRRKSWQAGATMFLVFGSLALLLSAIGLYSVISYAVTQRTSELGVRIALGARRAHVLRLIVGEGMRHAIVGVSIGAAVALVAAGKLQPLLFRQPARDPVILGSVIVILLLVACLASVIPAWRAARLDPSRALRAE